jgi:hypothetical protein
MNTNLLDLLQKTIDATYKAGFEAGFKEGVKKAVEVDEWFENNFKEKIDDDDQLTGEVISGG